MAGFAEKCSDIGKASGKGRKLSPLGSVSHIENEEFLSITLDGHSP